MPEQTEAEVMAELIRDEPDYAKKIPAITLHGIQQYVASGMPGGHFLERLLTNDLYGVFNYADAENWAALGHTLAYLQTIRQDCFGTKEKYAAWREKKRLDRLKWEEGLNPEEGT
jgi:hypothetical protein